MESEHQGRQNSLFQPQGNTRVPQLILKRTVPSVRFNNDLGQDYIMIAMLAANMDKSRRMRLMDMLDVIRDVYYSCDDGWGIQQTIKAVSAGVPKMRGAMRGWFKRNKDQEGEYNDKDDNY